MAQSHPMTKNSRQSSHPVNYLQKLPQFKVWWLFKAEFSTGLSVGSEHSFGDSLGEYCPKHSPKQSIVPLK